MQSLHLEKIFFHFILNDTQLLSMTDQTFFESDFIRDMFGVGKEFVEKYNHFPEIKQFVDIAKGKNLVSTKDDIDKIKLLYKVNLSEYDEKWLSENVKAWIEFKNLDSSVLDLLTYMKTTTVTLENVSEIVDKAKDIINTRNNLTFDFNEGLNFFDASNHTQPTLDTFSTGYEYLDTVLGGGWSSKALYILVGATKSGKSIWLANLISNAVLNGYNSAFVTLEMRDAHVLKRIGANMLGVQMSEYAEFAKDTNLVKKKLGAVGYDSFKKPGNLFIKEYPTSSASVKDIENYLIRMEELKGIKFKTVFVDYINIMLNWRNPNTENTYMKIKQIAEDLRAMAQRNNWAVISLTQLNRNSAEAAGRLSIKDVAESSGLGHTVDWMGGIIQDPVMHANREYLLQTMLNRNEGYMNSRKRFIINYEYMRLSEDMESQIILE